MRAVRFTLCLFVVLVAHAAAVSAPGESAAEESGATGSDPLGGKKPSELIKDHQLQTGRCDDYCHHACGEFAWGGDTIIECNGCSTDDDKIKCHPGAEHYGDLWVESKVELSASLLRPQYIVHVHVVIMGCCKLTRVSRVLRVLKTAQSQSQNPNPKSQGTYANSTAINNQSESHSARHC